MLSLIIVACAILLALFLAFSKKLSGSSNWRATVTPLASIMGSGFLVSAPLLSGRVGNLAIFCMAGLLLIAYGVGGAIRYNIKYFEPRSKTGRGVAQSIALLSRIVLVAAYLISVTYYLQLLTAFLLSAAGIGGASFANWITTALLLIIGGVGMWRGLGMLERVEKYVIAFNLGAIGSLLIGLLIYNLSLVWAGGWSLPAVDSTIDLSDIRVLLGLLIVVQGFETSRYLGSEHPPEQRISTMRSAQLISSVIYLVFIGLVTVLFQQGLGADVTAIIIMTTPVAAALPILLSVAAIGSQFSAAVADNSGAGGLLGELTKGRLKPRYAYLLILVVTIAITWETNVNGIISYASRAFALFYVFQCVVAMIVAWQRREDVCRVGKLIQFGFLAFICLLVFALGLPAE